MVGNYSSISRKKGSTKIDLSFPPFPKKAKTLENYFSQATTLNGDPGICSSPHLTKMMYSPFSWTT
jgi:hypothetical protein